MNFLASLAVVMKAITDFVRTFLLTDCLLSNYCLLILWQFYHITLILLNFWRLTTTI